MATILISGGKGIIGGYLSRKLKDKGHSVAVLSRAGRKDTDIPCYTWDVDKRIIEKGAVESADCIIHLAGVNIGERRWTSKRKQLIKDSRVKSAELLFDRIKESKTKPKVFISASAVGYYGAVTSEKIFSESDPPCNDFLGEACRIWEQAADRFETLGIRTVKIRTGLVLTKEGGALKKMTLPVKLGIGSAIGSGRQYVPWIHIDDLCGIYMKALEDASMNGAYNAAAPDHKTNLDLTRSLARVLNKPFWPVSIPSCLLKLIYGSMSEIILKGSRISSEKIVTAGYRFRFPFLEGALMDLLNKKT